MNPQGPNPYLKTKIMTASPQELRLMLYDGAIKFSKQAQGSIEAGDREQAHNFLMRAQKIVLELSTSLNHEIEPALCEKLSALYTYIYRLLVDANMNQDAKPIEEALGLLDYERETWKMLIDRLAQEGDPVGKVSNDVLGARQTAISSLSNSA